MEASQTHLVKKCLATVIILKILKTRCNMPMKLLGNTLDWLQKEIRTFMIQKWCIITTEYPVWCLAESRKIGIAPKLERLYSGPFVIIRKTSEINFTLQIDESGKERLVHHNKLKKYEGNMPPKWAAKISMRLHKA
jgi:hypothetical protein